MTNERIKKSGQLLNKIYYVIKTYRSAQQFTTQTVQLTLKCIESKTFPRSSHSVRSKSPTHQSLPIFRVNFPTVTLTANATMVSRQFLKRKATATMLDCKQSRARPSRDQFGCINRFSFAFIVCVPGRFFWMHFFCTADAATPPVVTLFNGLFPILGSRSPPIPICSWWWSFVEQATLAT